MTDRKRPSGMPAILVKRPAGMPAFPVCLTQRSYT